MRFLVGIDDTDSSRGNCTTYLAYRIAKDLSPEIEVIPFPRLVRLNPNIPFKTRGNAAVCLELEGPDAKTTFEAVAGKVREHSDVEGGANSGMVMLDRQSISKKFGQLYRDAVTGVVNPHRARALLREAGAMSFELGNGMGVVGAAASLGFSADLDHTYELIAYRRKEYWGTRRAIESGSVRAMDAAAFPHTFNNYDYQKRKVLIAPHGPDPVFAGVRGDSPQNVVDAFRMLEYDELLDGHMVYVSNQHTDAHLHGRIEWKAYSSGWLAGRVEDVNTGPGGHVYVSLRSSGMTRLAAAYEPTGDLRRAARRLRPGMRVRAYGGVRRPTSRHTTVLNLERLEVLSKGRSGSDLEKGTYISSPRANRHLTKPLIRYGRECYEKPRPISGWLASATPRPVLV